MENVTNWPKLKARSHGSAVFHCPEQGTDTQQHHHSLSPKLLLSSLLFPSKTPNKSFQSLIFGHSCSSSNISTPGIRSTVTQRTHQCIPSFTVATEHSHGQQVARTAQHQLDWAQRKFRAAHMFCYTKLAANLSHLQGGLVGCSSQQQVLQKEGWSSRREEGHVEEGQDEDTNSYSCWGPAQSSCCVNETLLCAGGLIYSFSVQMGTK